MTKGKVPRWRGQRLLAGEEAVVGENRAVSLCLKSHTFQKLPCRSLWWLLTLQLWLMLWFYENSVLESCPRTVSWMVFLGGSREGVSGCQVSGLVAPGGDEGSPAWEPAPPAQALKEARGPCQGGPQVWGSASVQSSVPSAGRGLGGSLWFSRRRRGTDGSPDGGFRPRSSLAAAA